MLLRVRDKEKAMKEILISIQPQWVEKILNGEKTIEIRKTMPKCELPCKVYIYCTQPKKWWAFSNWGATSDELLWKMKDKVKMCNGFDVWDYECEKLNGKVVAEFTLKNIVKFDIKSLIFFGKEKELMQKSCVGGVSLKEYLGDKIGYAWGIDNLVVYEKPKYLSEFGRKCLQASEIHCRDCEHNKKWNECCGVMIKPIKKPPQSWCFVERS